MFVLWNVFTALGALAGDRMGDPARYGLDAAAAAAFLGLVWPRVTGPGTRLAQLGRRRCRRSSRSRSPPLVPAGIPVLLAAVVAIVAGLVARDPEEDA